MELSKKTTILLGPDLHRQLKRVAKLRGVSVGELVREACVARYGVGASSDRLAAVADLSQLDLPVASPEQMKQESVLPPDAALP